MKHFLLDIWLEVEARFPYRVKVPSLLPQPNEDFVCLSPFNSEAFAWCRDHFGDHCTAERLKVKDIYQDQFSLIEDSIWDVSGATFMFKNEKDALIFKLWFG
jgi:hypothetical protein